MVKWFKPAYMKNLLAVLLLILSTSIFAQRPQNQDPVTISGTVLEAGSNIPLEYATVSFIDSSDKVVTGGITDLNGIYKIDVPAGVYTVQYEFISYQTKRLTNQRLLKDTELPQVRL